MEKQGHYYCNYLGEWIYKRLTIATLGDLEITPLRLDAKRKGPEFLEFLEFLDWINEEEGLWVSQRRSKDSNG